MSRIVKRVVRASIVATALLVAAAPAGAQAWLPPQGEGAVSVLYQNMFVKYHALPVARVDVGQIRSHSLMVDFTYGITDQFAVSVGLPYVAAKYTGQNPHPVSFADTRPTPFDDGRYHGALQDFRFELKYNVTKRGVVLTPFVGTVMPSHDYPYFAHAAPGRRLRELQAGVAAARTLDRVLPGLFVQGRYAHGFTESVADVSRTRSLMDFEVGYFINERVRVLALSNGQVTHGGVDVVAGVARAQLGPGLFPYHDQIDRLNVLNLGAGAAVSLTDTIDLYGSFLRTVAQRNGHLLDRGIALGVSWGFTTRRAKSDRFMSQAPSTTATRSRFKCLCEKSAM